MRRTVTHSPGWANCWQPSPANGRCCVRSGGGDASRSAPAFWDAGDGLRGSGGRPHLPGRYQEEDERFAALRWFTVFRADRVGEEAANNLGADRREGQTDPRTRVPVRFPAAAPKHPITLACMSRDGDAACAPCRTSRSSCDDPLTLPPTDGRDTSSRPAACFSTPSSVGERH